ncbi:MAG: ribulose 1,5-bisphosphate carboxylase large subunit [Treponema sp.]|jgi:ribulose-bisphosphate carboxylase large chain|nr:ribulose 1,5-bisphosphate carboxylase large subunit [Treponema sp.]
MFFEDYDDKITRGLLSGNRFSVVYRLYGDERTVRSRAEDICAEQTVEFPVRFLPEGAIPDAVLGRIESLEKEDDGRWLARISFADEIAAGEFTQFLNVVFGNISIKQGIQALKIYPGRGILKLFPGPRFGIPGIRETVKAEARPLLFTALKPMGLSAANMAVLASQFVRGGVDIIKDDHGLSDQVFAPFEERVRRCADAVREENVKSGRSAIYVPNITAPADKLAERAFRAKELGAGALLIIPGLTGFDAMRSLAASGIDLPIFSHPAFAGTYAINPQGIAPELIFGLLPRLAGADAAIFPNYGGRFPLTRDDCLGIARACREDFGAYEPVFPSPAGGMELGSIGGMIQSYGRDFLALVGGGLFNSGADLVDNCRRFLETLGQ